MLIEKRTFELDQGTGEISHGNLAVNKWGKLFSVYNPGQILLFVPVYYVSGFLVSDPAAAYYTAAFLASFFGYLIFGLIILTFNEFGKKLQIPQARRWVITFLFSFTSYCFAHAQDSYEHIYEALFLLLTLYLISNRFPSTKHLLLAATLFGLSILFRTSAMIALPSLLWLIRSWQRKLLFLAVLIPFIILLLYYNYIRFGDSLETGYAIAWSHAFGTSSQKSFSLMHLPKNLAGLLFSFGKGLLFFSPSLLLIGWSLKRFRTAQYHLFVCITIITVSYLIFYAANFAWHGSAWNWGPRYIVPAVPLLYLSLFYIPYNKKRLVMVIGTISLLVQILAVSTFYKRQLVKTLVKEGDVFWSDRYFFSPSYSPIKGQSISFVEVTSSMLSGGRKELFLPAGPWRNEGRPASQKMMLNQSIDLNVYNFWWVRAFYIYKDILPKVMIGIFMTLILLILTLQGKALWEKLKIPTTAVL